MHALQKLIVLAAGAAGAAAGDGGPTVTLPAGVVVGTTTMLSGATAAVDKFVGIPFAQSPPERFAPPKAAASWTMPLQAVETKPACVQQFSFPKAEQKKAKKLFNNPGGPAPEESEDCLYLNVYVPPNTKPSDGKAVMFWIYGGNLQFGDGSLIMYDGSSFAYNQDVILVTHNYRTNVFGFPNAPEIGANKQNAGFLDQRLALSWVQDNIGAFGGDPAKVTIFGESAGGDSVKQLIATPPSPLPFRAAIMESQATLFTGINGTASWETLVDMLGCTGKKSELKCVRGKDVSDIKKTIQRNTLGFPPVANGLTDVADARDPIRKGTSVRVPVLIGTNSGEGRVFAYLVGLDHAGGDVGAFLKGEFPNTPSLRHKLKKRFKKFPQTPYRFASDVITNSTFTCPTSMLASFAHKHGYDVWRYYYNAFFENINLFPHAGVFHTAEIPEVFGTYPTEGATKQQKKLSKFMQGAWAGFAKHPHKGPGWAQLGDKGKVAEIGAHGSTGETIISADGLDKVCSLYAPVITNL